MTLRGDLAALLASLCFVGYLLIGQRLRVWMPAFVYAFCVTALAALLLTLGGLLFEGAALFAAGRRGVLGWAGDLHYLPFVAYLAVGPGIVGHTGGLQAGKQLLLTMRTCVGAWRVLCRGEGTARRAADTRASHPHPRLTLCSAPARPQASTRCCATWTL